MDYPRPSTSHSPLREQAVKDYVRQARQRINAGQSPPPYMTTRPSSENLDQAGQWPLPSSTFVPPQHKLPSPKPEAFPFPPTQRPVTPKKQAPRQQPLAQSRDPRLTSQRLRIENASASAQPRSAQSPPNRLPYGPAQSPPPQMRYPAPRPMNQIRYPQQSFFAQRDPMLQQSDLRPPTATHPAHRPPANWGVGPPPRQPYLVQPPRPGFLADSLSHGSVPSVIDSDDDRSFRSAAAHMTSDDSENEDILMPTLAPARTGSPGSPHRKPVARRQMSPGANMPITPSTLAASALAASSILGASLATPSAAKQVRMHSGGAFHSSVALPGSPSRTEASEDDPRSPIDVHVAPAEDEDRDLRPSSSSKLLAAPTIALGGARPQSPSLGVVPEDSDRLEPPKSPSRGVGRRSRSPMSYISVNSNSNRNSQGGRVSPRPQGNLLLLPNSSRESVRLSRFGRPANATRESTTSLQGVIRRALRLASNLESGKTASRFGVDWMAAENSGDNVKNAKHQSDGSMASMINQFPNAPGAAALKPASVQRTMVEWPNTVARNVEATNDHSPTHDGEKITSSKRKRRVCCGMPMWLFIFLLILIVLVVAAAVIIPVALIVIPNQHHSADSSSASTTSGTDTCATTLPCANGGMSVLSATHSCQCLCTNGFSGTSCTERSDPACVTQDFNNAPNATIGSAIPALIDASSSTYNVPLNGPALLSLFSSADLSCTGENQLVTLNGLTSRSLIHSRRQTDTSSSSFQPDSSLTMNFARVAILYLFQATENLNSATTAQSVLQTYYRSPSSYNAESIDLGSGWTVNLVQGSLLSETGQTVGNSTTG